LQEVTVTKIRLLRAELSYLGVKQADAAAHVGIPVGRLSQLLNGRVRPRGGELLRLGRYLDQVRKDLALVPLQEAVALEAVGRLPVIAARAVGGKVKVNLGPTARVLPVRQARLLSKKLETAIAAASA
jgi:hypothetical protein